VGRERTASKQFQVVRRYIRNGSLLDVGCGSGIFLAIAENEGWRVAGVEPSQLHFEIASRSLSKRAKILCCTLDHADLPVGSFDAVTLWDVLEHVTDPMAFLARCKSLLNPQGFLFANVPDLDSWQARLLGSRWPLLLPEHLNYFNDNSLRQAFNKAGFQLVCLGRRPTYFSIDYFLHGVVQHGVAGTSLLKKISSATGLGKLVLPIYIGERLAISRPA
jgi:SAM-dependent methyltransferase